MKKIVITSIAVLAIIAASIGGWYYMKYSKYVPDVYITETQTTDESTGTTTTTTTTIDTTKNTETSGTPTFTMAEVATHTTLESCYTVISGTVYDLTLWVNLHPGGKNAILSICGIDGTERFMNKHKGGDKFMAILERYKIGKVTQ